MTTTATTTAELINRNAYYAKTFAAADLPVLPHLRTVVLTCVDARVDPAHVLGLDLGDAVVMRNNGGRVTQDVINEIATLAFMVSKITGEETPQFEVVIMQHTNCGAERFADPEFQHAIKGNLGIDVSETAIHDHNDSLVGDVERLRAAREVPDFIVVSGLLYDVKIGKADIIIPPESLR